MNKLPICILLLLVSISWAATTGVSVTVVNVTTQVNGTVMQIGNATVGQNVTFGVNVSGTGMCYYTIPNDRIMGLNDLWINNKTNESVNFINSTTWVVWNCSVGASPYYIYWREPAPIENCTGTDGYIQDNGYISTISNQYITRNCTLYNPSVMNFTNVSGSLGCLSGMICDINNQSILNLESSTSDIISQNATGNVFNNSVSDAYMNDNITLNITANDTILPAYITWKLNNSANITFNNVVANYTESNIICTNCNFILNFTPFEVKDTNVTFNVSMSNAKTCYGGLAPFSQALNCLYNFTDNYSRVTHLTVLMDKDGSTTNNFYLCTQPSCDINNIPSWTLTTATEVNNSFIKSMTMPWNISIMNSYASVGGGGGGGTINPLFGLAAITGFQNVSVGQYKLPVMGDACQSVTILLIVVLVAAIILEYSKKRYDYVQRRW